MLSSTLIQLDFSSNYTAASFMVYIYGIIVGIFFKKMEGV